MLSTGDHWQMTLLNCCSENVTQHSNATGHRINAAMHLKYISPKYKMIPPKKLFFLMNQCASSERQISVREKTRRTRLMCITINKQKVV